MFSANRSSDSKQNSLHRIWNRFLGKISIWTVIASMSGSGAGAVSIQHNHNVGII